MGSKQGTTTPYFFRSFEPISPVRIELEPIQARSVAIITRYTSTCASRLGNCPSFLVF